MKKIRKITKVGRFIIKNEKELVLDAMKKAGEPVNAGKIVELTGLDRKIVDKAMAELKKRRTYCIPYSLQMGTSKIKN